MSSSKMKNLLSKAAKTAISRLKEIKRVYASPPNSLRSTTDRIKSAAISVLDGIDDFRHKHGFGTPDYLSKEERKEIRVSRRRVKKWMKGVGDVGVSWLYPDDIEPERPDELLEDSEEGEDMYNMGYGERMGPYMFE